MSNALQEIWYGERVPPWWARALARAYGWALRQREVAYARGKIAVQRVGVPVVVVGNITVGGTGKTPLTIWLAQEFMRCGVRVGVVLRGHGGRARRPMRVSDRSDPAEVGDEAVLIRLRARCPVAIGHDRPAAAGLLVRDGVQLIVSDDGLQHLRLGRDFEIAVLDGERLLGNGQLLPAGPLREPPERLTRVDAVVFNGGASSAHSARGFASVWSAGLPACTLTMHLRGGVLQAVGRDAARSARVPIAELGAQTVHAVAGVGNPERFFKLLRAAGLTLIEHRFPDHHPFRPGELRFGDALPVLMTEKDAVKCRGFALSQHWCLPVDAYIDRLEAHRLLEKIVMDARLLDILVCPLCKGPLQYDKPQAVLVCRAERLAYPIRDGVPVMLEEEAKVLASDDPLLSK